MDLSNPPAHARVHSNFSLTASQTVDLAIDGRPYRRVTNFTAVPADNDASFGVLGSSVVAQPDFDLT